MADKKQNRSKKELSAGLIVYRPSKEGPKFLIMYHRGSYWNFPKGKLESGEKNIEAAIRETSEETGIKPKDLRLKKGFRVHEKYQFKGYEGPINKTVTLYLAEARDSRVKVSPEHEGYGWFLYKEARKLLSKHKESLDVLKRAYDFIQRKSGQAPSSKRAASREHRRGSQQRS